MGKSYTELKKEFEQEWAKNLKLYIKAGMSPEFIAAMREFDEEVFRKERAFQDNIPARIEYWDDPRLDNPVEYLSRLKKDLDTQLEDISPGLSQRATWISRRWIQIFHTKDGRYSIHNLRIWRSYKALMGISWLGIKSNPRNA